MVWSVLIVVKHVPKIVKRYAKYRGKQFALTVQNNVAKISSVVEKKHIVRTHSVMFVATVLLGGKDCSAVVFVIGAYATVVRINAMIV